ncbi:MAG: hypothetical protein M1835_004698 [Candelina submexicana]|nr:MAG: hypothetical protein M1835_004698 [Candelina submexicana]
MSDRADSPLTVLSRTPSLPPDSDLRDQQKAASHDQVSTQHKKKRRTKKSEAVNKKPEASNNSSSGSRPHSDGRQDRPHSTSSKKPEASGNPSSASRPRPDNHQDRTSSKKPEASGNPSSASRSRPDNHQDRTSSKNPEASDNPSSATRPHPDDHQDRTSSKKPEASGNSSSASRPRHNVKEIQGSNRSDDYDQSTIRSVSVPGDSRNTSSSSGAATQSSLPAPENSNQAAIVETIESEEPERSSSRINEYANSEPGAFEFDQDSEEDDAEEDDPSADDPEEDDSESESEIDFSPQSLHKRITKDYGLPSRGKVLLWRKMGRIGFQVLVEHKIGNAVTYRMEPGSTYARDFDPNDPTTHIPKQYRGNDRYEDGTYKYTEHDIEAYSAVAWKSEEEDVDDPAAVLYPEPKASYPNTYIRVRWFDQVETWEPRIYMRRMVGKPNMRADSMVHAIARHQEKRFMKARAVPRYPVRSTQGNRGAFDGRLSSRGYERDIPSHDPHRGSRAQFYGRQYRSYGSPEPDPSPLEGDSAQDPRHPNNRRTQQTRFDESNIRSQRLNSRGRHYSSGRRSDSGYFTEGRARQSSRRI